MQNEIIISPSFIDRDVPQLAELDLPGAIINDPDRIGADQQAKVACVHRPLAKRVASAIAAGNRPVSIAGDCCTAIALVAGLQHGGIEATLVWLDAHGDFNTWETSPSGFLGGMPLAMIVGQGDMSMPNAVEMIPLEERNIILADGRDLDPEEAVAVESSAMVHVCDFAELLDMPLPDGPLYVHFDSDVIDCTEAPGHNYPVPGGPDAMTVNAVMQRLAATGRVVAASMSAWNPELDQDGQTGKICMNAFMRLIEER